MPNRPPAPAGDGVPLLADALREAGGAVGVPSGAESHLRMPLGDFARLKAVAGVAFTGDGRYRGRGRGAAGPRAGDAAHRGAVLARGR
jgi:hypothetical protein